MRFEGKGLILKTGELGWALSVGENPMPLGVALKISN